MTKLQRIAALSSIVAAGFTIYARVKQFQREGKK